MKTKENKNMEIQTLTNAELVTIEGGMSPDFINRPVPPFHPIYPILILW